MNIIFVSFAIIAIITNSVSAVQLDKQKVLKMADSLELTNLLQEHASVSSSNNRKNNEAVATSNDIAAGNFEIKCATSCEFVTKGNGGDALILQQTREAYVDAANGLADAQETLLAAKKSEEAAPGEEFAMNAVKAAEDALQRKIFALQSIVGGRIPDALVSDATNGMKKELARINAALIISPTDKSLMRQRDELEKAMGGVISSPAMQTQTELGDLQHKYDLLKNKMANTPDDADVAKELFEVESQIGKLSGEGGEGGMSPKKECYRICVDPHLPKNAAVDHVDNCVRMCVKVMRSLVFNMAKKFF